MNFAAPVKTLILCPLKLEKKLLLQALQEDLGLGVEISSRGAWVPEKSWLILSAGMGKVEFALSALEALRNFPQAQSLWCVGSAGALSDELQCGDIIIGTESVEHDFKSSLGSQALPRFASDIKLIQQIQAQSSAHDSLKPRRIHFGPIASGDEDILSRKRAEEVLGSTGALAVAWEGAGGARACLKAGKDFLEIRAITDRADSSTFDDFKSNIKQSMKGLAQVLLFL